MGSSDPFLDPLNLSHNQSATTNALLNSPHALALMAQLMPQNQNHLIQPQINSPIFNNISSPSSSSTSSSTPLPILHHPNMQQNNNSNGIDSSQSLCAICADKATGRHYGCVNSCDGCKGFFRRSIRKAHAYRCRFNNNCDVSKSHRNSCRACRLRRCLAAGMRIDAIQQERDAIGKRRKLDDDAEGNGFLKCLLDSEKLCAQLRDSVIKSTGQVVYDKGKIKFEPNDKIASLNDVGTSIHQQLVLTVEWAKSLNEFRSLSLDDQASLLRLNATSLIVFAVALRSLHTENGICLANDKLLPTEHAALVGDINAVVGRIVTELVKPMRDLEVDTQEYVALKAVMFFNPYNLGSSATGAFENLKRIRLEALRALKTASLKGQPQIGMDDECRFGQLLLLLPSVQAVAQQLVEDVQLCRLFQLTNVDELMQALILHEKTEEKAIIVEQLTGHANSSSNIFKTEFKY